MTEPTTPTLRESLEAVIEETPIAAADPAPAPEPSAEPAPEIEASAPAADAPDLEAMAEAEAAPGRDEQGRFKAKEQKPQDDGMQPGPKPGPKLDRAPAAWKPEVREHWGHLPETVRAEIARREVEVQRTMQESAEARKGYEAVMRTIQPYEGFIRAEGSNALQAIDNLMSTAARLRTGTAPELATMMAGLVQQFGIGRFGQSFIDQLDSALAGNAPRAPDPQTAQVQQVIQQQLAPVQQFMSQFQQAQAAQQQRAAQAAASEVEQFLSKAEFGNDVRQDMADIIELAAKRGQNLTLQQAYERAVSVNDSVRAAMAQRQRSQGLQQQTQAAQRAKAAAVSVSGSAPMGALRQDPTDIRSAIEAAIQMTSR